MDTFEIYHSQVMDTLRFIIIYKRWPTTRVMHTFKFVIYKMANT